MRPSLATIRLKRFWAQAALKQGCHCACSYLVRWRSHAGDHGDQRCGQVWRQYARERWDQAEWQGEVPALQADVRQRQGPAAAPQVPVLHSDRQADQPHRRLNARASAMGIVPDFKCSALAAMSCLLIGLEPKAHLLLLIFHSVAG